MIEGGDLKIAITGNPINKERKEVFYNMSVDRVANWKNFSQHMSRGRNSQSILQKTD